MKKKCLLFFMMVVIVMSMCGISNVSRAENTDRLAPGEGISALDGKKVLFVGCSYTFNGGTVILNSSRNNDVYITTEDRDYDQGFFYQLCKANGAEVNVVDWTFSGHDLTDIFDGSCMANSSHLKYDHLKDLTDRVYDYVVLQAIRVPGFDTPEDHYEYYKKIAAIFKEANPDVKIFYDVTHGNHLNYERALSAAVEMIEKEGAVIIDWGSLVWDLIKGNVSVPGGTFAYNKSSFIVSKTANDGYHQNVLSGYLYALMTYCAITGETAVGQEYSFCVSDTPVDDYYLPENYIKTHYVYDNPSTTDVDESKTNYVEVMTSETEMRGIQQLVDEYLTKRAWLNHIDNTLYTVKFQYEDGTVISEKQSYKTEPIVAPESPEKPSDNTYKYVFKGWDKEVEKRVSGDVIYTAVYDAKYIDYTVTFKNDDGTEISTGTYHYGDMVSVPQAPTKEADESYSYAFSGWDKEVVSCAGDTVYTAVFERTKISRGLSTELIIGIAAGALVLVGVTVGFGVRKKNKNGGRL